jgi:hypothetical protein
VIVNLVPDLFDFEEIIHCVFGCDSGTGDRNQVGMKIRLSIPLGRIRWNSQFLFFKDLLGKNLTNKAQLTRACTRVGVKVLFGLASSFRQLPAVWLQDRKVRHGFFRLLSVNVLVLNLHSLVDMDHPASKDDVHKSSNGDRKGEPS